VAVVSLCSSSAKSLRSILSGCAVSTTTTKRPVKRKCALVSVHHVRDQIEEHLMSGAKLIEMQLHVQVLHVYYILLTAFTPDTGTQRLNLIE
jgi:hypothetical protein